MLTSRVSPRRDFLVPFLVLFGAFLASCAFRPGYLPPDCKTIETIPFTQLTSNSSHTVFETPGTIIAIHGSGSAQLNSGEGRADFGIRIIRVEQNVPIPNYANKAAVFLNGWRLNYLGSDHNVLALGTMIAKIRTVRIQEQPRIGWNALGVLIDEGGNEGYNLSYNFTVIAWNDGNLDATVDQGVIDANDQYQCSSDGKTISDNYVLTGNWGATTALASFFSFIQNNAFAGKDKTVAVLPRGFGFTFFESASIFGNDHNLLQMAYNLDHSEIFADSNKKYSKQNGQMNAPTSPFASLVDSGFVSWGTSTIFKDNDTRRDYLVGEIVSGLGGNDVGVVQPPFSILPKESSWFCSTQDSPPVRTEEVVIENIPFEFAIPMLTGWDLEYLCSDQNVKEIGIWIDNWKYEPAAGGGGGTLRYTLGSVLRDDDNNPDYVHDHKITILGLRRVVAVGPGGPLRP